MDVSLRNLTKTDILYGLQYEVFEFLQREDLTQGLNEIRSPEM